MSLNRNLYDFIKDQRRILQNKENKDKIKIVHYNQLKPYKGMNGQVDNMGHGNIFKSVEYILVSYFNYRYICTTYIT